MSRSELNNGGFLKFQQSGALPADVQVIEISGFGENATQGKIVKYLGGRRDLEFEVPSGEYVVRMHARRAPIQAEMVFVNPGETTILHLDVPRSQALHSGYILPPSAADSRIFYRLEPHRSADLIAWAGIDNLQQLRQLPDSLGAGAYQLWTSLAGRTSSNIPELSDSASTSVLEWWCRGFESLENPFQISRSPFALTHSDPPRLGVFKYGQKRAYASLVSSNARFLVCPYLLAWPTSSAPSDIAPASIELVEAPAGRPDKPVHLAARIDDPEFNVCMGFLQAGNTVATAAVLRGNSLLLYEKFENPVAAAGVALALLALAADHQWEGEWRYWIGKLYDLFPDLPDAAVVRAMCYLRFGDVSEDDHINIEILREFALNAVRRGLPYYSRSVLELLEILRLVQLDDEASRKAGPEVTDTSNATHLVKQLAQLLVPGEVFTSLALDLHECYVR